ncbi:MAG: hypothetical protein UR39_C0001G0135 [Candidatus Woesebacteria bacterium GW2011_GWA1_33_30]|uniref:Glycosyltransferase RgtA/B/C/D-like domain-containing protein n=1 Tax=Candidatus Woesebacteria bacterium GW2011_GWA2_33_28 TaxID=1618561 RepID=A0A0G0CAW1_9BACT|nr:MAG: hypothetical protein UR38_C0001G0136 [Candidatus Woesebacteria bacterium GW2011_GWA2_33_28]KKP49102.1 MAG: hypothetical protein UR39_C0001G0135 [Candidatus Woesebacteria bacterium GW2011_GWA1_33_30]KKP50298.1 MAG: hypothetical protein UR40_C0001G0040 [Microgenomates group bacterium GW2011_GWC1_33_32]KKP52693.1 MAG: hypothetical protein UR44_C0001G0135 [Candidatus Woesebacteria bacterium GW2011_GWB1_33_38]KKP58724.1 MAG: hypothetical protein UR48_C0002G0020 [Microgenomates group bacteriu
MKKYIWLIVIIFIAILLRLLLITSIQGTSGGDAFEFLLIAKRIISFENPFLDVKRLPFFPITLIPSYFLNIDGIMWGRIVNTIFAGLSLYYMYLIGDKFKISKFLNYLSLILFTFSSVYLFYSLRPLSSSLFTLLFLSSIYYTLESKKTSILFAFTSLGLLSMTRHEGFLISLIIFLYYFWSTKRKDLIVKFSKPCLIYLILVLPFFLNNYIYHKNFLYLGYLDDGGGLYIPKNYENLASNLKIMSFAIYSTWGNIRIFKTNINLLNILFSSTVIFIALGLIDYLKKINKQKMLALILLISQLIIALWFQPSGRYIQHLTPFLSTLLLLGISKFSKVILPILITGALVTTSLYTVKLKIDEFNFDTKGQKEFTDSIKYLKVRSGIVAIEPDRDYTQSYIAKYYLGDSRIKFIGGDFLGRGLIDSNPRSQINWLQSENVKYIVDSPKFDDFTFLGDNRYQGQFIIKTNYVYEVIKK